MTMRMMVGREALQIDKIFKKELQNQMHMRLWEK
jgi:hypothetical protein